MITCNKCGRIFTTVKDIPVDGCCPDEKKEITIQAIKATSCKDCIFEEEWNKLSIISNNKINECPYNTKMIDLGLPNCDQDFYSNDGFIFKLKED